jgi:hypothetical protein
MSIVFVKFLKKRPYREFPRTAQESGRFPYGFAQDCRVFFRSTQLQKPSSPGSVLKSGSNEHLFRNVHSKMPLTSVLKERQLPAPPPIC